MFFFSFLIRLNKLLVPAQVFKRKGSHIHVDPTVNALFKSKVIVFEREEKNK